MIKIEITEVVGWRHAIRGMRNPMNSWEKSDSHGECPNGRPERWCGYPVLGPNDLELMKKLAKAGTEHAKYRRMIVVYCDVTAPLYWWKEFDTYKVGTVANSCSTMHKIHAKEFTLDDFSHEQLLNNGLDLFDYISSHDQMFKRSIQPIQFLNDFIIPALNTARERYLETHNKDYWWQMIQLLPSSYNQRRTVMMNYEVLANIYRQRQSHKLDEWQELCKWAETLPYSELITLKED